MKRTGHPTYHNKTGQLVIALGYVLGAAACDVGTTPANAARLLVVVLTLP